MGLLWPMLIKDKRCFRSLCVKFPFVSMSASFFFFDVNVFDLFLIDSVEQSIKSNYVGSGNLSHCVTSSL